jgi:DNA-binding winged helix-turn-helix (wHTH) protein
MEGKDKFFYPVPKDYLEKFFKSIFSFIERNESFFVVFPANCGGGRAWFKFFLQNPELFKSFTPKKTAFIYLDPAEAVPRSTKGYLLLLAKELGVDLEKGIEEKPVLALLETLKKILRERTEKGERIILFLGKLDELEFLSPELCSILFALWQVNKFKIIIAGIFYSRPEEEDFKIVYKELSEALLQNILPVKPLTEKEGEYVLDFWKEKLSLKLEKEAEVKLLAMAKGLPYLIKVGCLALKERKGKTTEDCFKKYPLLKFLLSAREKKISVNKTGELEAGGVCLADQFGNKEAKVLKLLIAKKGEVITKDEIAEAMWGEEADEKFSDWAISQMIMAVRKKLGKLEAGVTIKNIKGRGYLLQ